MKFFKEIDLPQTCYLIETVYWLALGRLPEIITDEDGNDGRTGRYADYEGQVENFNPMGFTDAEFSKFGIEVDMERYWEAQQASGGRTGSEYIEHRERIRASIEASLHDEREASVQETGDVEREWLEAHLETQGHAEFLREQYQGIAAEADWARSIEKPLNHQFSLARVKVLQAILSGELSSFGWVEYTDEERVVNAGGERDGYSGGFADIPSHDWADTGFDWRESTLTTSERVYHAVQVDVSEMLDLFRKPAVPSEEASATVYGEYAILTHDSPVSVAPSKRGKGRPAVGDGLVRQALQNLYGEKYYKAADGMRESIIAEAMTYSLAIFNIEVKRATVQDYLRPPRAESETAA